MQFHQWRTHTHTHTHSGTHKCTHKQWERPHGRMKYAKQHTGILEMSDSCAERPKRSSRKTAGENGSL